MTKDSAKSDPVRDVGWRKSDAVGRNRVPGKGTHAAAPSVLPVQFWARFDVPFVMIARSQSENILRLKSWLPVAGTRFCSNASEGLAPTGPLSGTPLGPSESSEANIIAYADASAGVLKSRASGKIGLYKGDSGPKLGPFSAQNTEETDGVDATEGAEGARDSAEKVKANDDANMASMKEEAVYSPGEFKSAIT
ncbi:hypothetical protein AXG93_1130s1250 [Marchantia polymorpha subsp. ruderalis]|uniref:Uncharacterized protein n=1 Tax=Marchantia polymorpha subsp. ruderalis TaxID=1480154 RepID=A0A176VHN1_MARPO|nr:hypothetical protein AXG93_1130s1250 [Marchantia polymorpha subsp. ruderalis]